MRAWVDPDRCAGHGICTTICPEVFAITADGYSEVTVDEVPPHLEGAVRDAIKQCPERAIDDITADVTDDVTAGTTDSTTKDS